MGDRNGGTNDSENQRRLDQIEDVIQSMITLVLEQGKAYDRQHEHAMAAIREQRAEIQDLIRPSVIARSHCESFDCPL